MSDHHPDAETVLRADSLFNDCLRITGATGAKFALAALSAAGLAVVRVGDVPRWMEQMFSFHDGDRLHPIYRLKPDVVKDTP